MLKKLSSIFLLFFLIFTLSGCSQRISVGESKKGIDKNTQTIDAGNKKLNNYPVSSAENVADKLEVYYFYRTARCSSCKTIGQYVRETMEEKYSQQIKDGKIDFRELNVELPDSKEIAKRYQASGSSLFINRIIGDKDNIEQDTNVWRLLSNEAQFKIYLENKINSYLGM